MTDFSDRPSSSSLDSSNSDLDPALVEPHSKIKATSPDVDQPDNLDPSAEPINSDIKVTLASEDVAIATLDETPQDPASQDLEVSDDMASNSQSPNSENFVATEQDNDSATNSEKLSDSETAYDPLATANIDTANIDNDRPSAVSTAAVTATNNPHQPSHKIIEDPLTDSVKKSADTSLKAQTDAQADTQSTDTSDVDTDEAQETREELLESYKQFVAEQQNNRKIDYAQVRVNIEANALPSKMYFLMNALSAIIASYGLVANSVAVVIGAMLVAMMLGPITGVALAIIDYRMPLLRKSLFTVAAGGALVVSIGFIVGLMHYGQPLTNEILSRTQPTSMDLMIALAGGTAGAYAMISPHLSVAVVGVAVATALVPPLAASGILFANGEMSLGFGALLLAITNIIAIQFTNAMVLWFAGFRRLVDDDYKSSASFTFFRRNAVTLTMLIGLGIYLSFNLKSIAKQQKFETNVKAAINDHFIDKGNVLTNTQFEKKPDYQIIRAVVRGETDPSPYDVQQIEAAIMKDIHENFPKYQPVKLQLRYLPVQVIESNPMTTEKLDETDAAILTN